MGTPNPVGGDDNKNLPNLYMWLYKNRKSNRRLSSHNKAVRKK